MFDEGGHQMAQLLGIILVVILFKVISDYFKPGVPKSKPSPKGDFIDVSEKWINTDDMPYKKNDYLLDRHELSVFQLVDDLLQETGYTVYPHIRLADLLSVPAETLNRQEYLFRIKERSLDMVIVEIKQLKPVLAINLESPGNGNRAHLPDPITENALKSAGLKSIVINLYNPPGKEELTAKLRGLGLEL